MKKIGVMIILLVIIPVFAYAAEISIVHEERALKQDDNLATVLEELVGIAIQKSKKHSCIVKGYEEGREIRAKIRFGSTESGIAFAEIISDECESQ